MPSFYTYKNLQLVTPDPIGAGGLSINNNFKTIADEIDSVSGLLGSDGTVNYVNIVGGQGYWDVTNPTITSSGNVTLNFSSQNKNLFFASNSGTNSVPDFRHIYDVDLPSVSSSGNGIVSSAFYPVLVSGVLSNKAINTTFPLVGGGNLTTDRTLSMGQASATASGWLSKEDWIRFNTASGTGGSGGSGSGSVNWVGMTVPGVVFDSPIVGSPVTSSGTFGLALKIQPSGVFLGGPANSSTSGTPTFRQINWSDIPIRNINTSAPISGGGNLNNDLTIVLPQSSSTVSGYLSSTDWQTFNNKTPTSRSISTTSPLTGGGDFSADRTFAIPKATSSVDGYLAAADFATFSSGGGGGGGDNVASGTQILPKRADFYHEDSIVLTGSGLHTDNGSGDTILMERTYQNPPASGNSFSQGFLLASGYYNFKVIGEKHIDAGFVDWSVDSNSIVTGQDWYASGTALGVQTSSISIPTHGWHVLQGTVNTHNASSSGYYAYLNRFAFIPTSDSTPVSIGNFAQTFGASGPSHSTGQVPDPGSTSGIIRFLREDSTWQVPLGGESSGEFILSGTTTLSAGSSTYEDTGLSIDLPTSGTYLINFSGRIYAASTGSPASVYSVCKLVNTTDSADVTNSEFLVFDLAGLGSSIPASTGIEFPTTFSKLVTVTGAKTIKIQIQMTIISGSLSSKLIFSDGTGRSRMIYTQVS